MYQYHYQRPTPHLLLFDIAQGKMYDSALLLTYFGFNREIGTAFETMCGMMAAPTLYPSSALVNDNREQ